MLICDQLQKRLLSLLYKTVYWHRDNIKLMWFTYPKNVQQQLRGQCSIPLEAQLERSELQYKAAVSAMQPPLHLLYGIRSRSLHDMS